MIIFDGVSLDSVAPVKIEDIRVSPVALNPVIRERAMQGGADFVRMRDNTRTVAITFAMLEENMIDRQNSLREIGAWAKRGQECPLILPQDVSRCLYAVCTAYPEPSVRQWWESKLRLVFTCYDNPYWTSLQEKSAACGSSFFAQGDAPPLMRIERTLSSSASDQSYGDGARTMTFSTIPAGSLVIDLNKQTAAVGSTSIMQYYTYTSQFIVPHTGQQTITGTGTIKYRERWV